MNIINFNQKYYFSVSKKLIHLCNNKTEFNILISGGKTIKKVLINFIKNIKLNMVINFYLIDERISSNIKMTNYYNLNKLFDNKNENTRFNLNSLNNNKNPKISAISYNKKLSKINFDLSIISFANDGHIGSIDPINFSNQKFNKKNYQLINDFIHKPHQRFTLTFKKIQSSNLCWLLIDSQKKYNIFRKNNYKRYFNDFDVYIKS